MRGITAGIIGGLEGREEGKERENSKALLLPVASIDSKSTTTEVDAIRGTLNALMQVLTSPPVIYSVLFYGNGGGDEASTTCAEEIAMRLLHRTKVIDLRHPSLRLVFIYTLDRYLTFIDTATKRGVNAKHNGGPFS